MEQYRINNILGLRSSEDSNCDTIRKQHYSGDYSVVTDVASFLTAAFIVCQGNVAHLTLLGYSRTPASTASFPSSSNFISSS
jgi:hypothetical protein